jgi:hypothetical protein
VTTIAVQTLAQFTHLRPRSERTELRREGHGPTCRRQEAESARGLRAQITSGVNVVELEPELIEPSLYGSNSQTDDEAFAT